MAKVKIKPDHAGMAAVLAGGKVSGSVMSAARMVAGRTNATAHGEPIPTEVAEHRVQLSRDPIPRAGAEVILQHPAAVRVEAKRGTLAKAAAATGLQVRKW